MQQRWSKRILDVLRANFRRGVLFLLGSAIAVAMVLTPMMTKPANAQLAGFQSLGGSFTNSLSSCAIETVGWVVCPTMISIAKLADYGFTYINQNFLRIDYALAANDSGTYTAWEIMRNVANALFVVAFMVLVYSQLTGHASGGYNIKRLLPRLIIAAIAVNVSYYLCILLIDISNILGDSILAILVGVSERIGTSVMPIGEQANAFQDGTLTVIASSVMAKPGIAWVLLTPVAAVVVSIATICAAGLVLLILRKTVIAMLILAAPILFVAYLLPNLERYFTQGARLFIQLLALYPIIALLLGAGQIVSATIVSVGTNDANYRVSGDSYFSRGGGSGSAITDLTAAAAAVLPLLAVWFLFKNMSSIMSTAGSRLSASIRGRRGGSEDKDARVTGKAAVGAARVKNAAGINKSMGNRRQAYTRNRRRATLGGSSLTGEGDGRSGLANRQPQTPMVSSVLEGGAVQGDKRTSEEEAAKRFEELQNAQLNGSPGELNVDDAVAAAVAGNKEQEQEKSKTAKDIFNSMNKTRDHESKDKERKFSAGAPAAGSSGGGSQASGSNQPSAPTVNYRAPSMAQNNNIVSGGSVPTGGSQQPTKIVAVPVQVDASALLGQNKQPAAGSQNSAPKPPVSGTEEKAKARAQKYLFDAERDLDEARDKQDILGHKVDEPTEMPHVPVHTDKDKDG